MRVDRDQLEALRLEAWEACDALQVAICELALFGAGVTEGAADGTELAYLRDTKRTQEWATGRCEAAISAARANT